jgi:DNA-binding MarR family transcriptional regulator
MYQSSRRSANLAGAWALTTADALRAATARAGGGSLPAALVTLAAFSGEPVERLGRTLGISQPGAVRLVDRLVGDGLARRAPGPDGRTLAIELTTAGQARAHELLTARARALEELLAPLDAEERATLERLLAKLLHSAGATGDARHVCRLCARATCPRCPVAAGAKEAQSC